MGGSSPFPPGLKTKKTSRRRARFQRAPFHASGSPGASARPAIDFAAVRAALTLAAVLQLLGFKATSSRGARQRGPCPLHGSTSGTGRCFSANLDEHTFHCFKCGRSGNVLDLWAPANRLSTYDAAIDLCARLNILNGPACTPLAR